MASLVIEGGFIADQARLTMLSDRAADAWRLLAEALTGGSEGELLAAIPQILDGRKTLAGDSHSGIDIVDDFDESYGRQLAQLYAGRIRIGTGWYRPCAKVVRCSPEANKAALSQVSEDEVVLAGFLKRVNRARVSYYANEGQRVVEVAEANGSTFMIFEPCGEPPFWWRSTPKDVTEAVAQYLSAGNKLLLIDDARDNEGERIAAAVTQRPGADVFEIDDVQDDEGERRRIAAAVMQRAGADVFELVTKSGRKFSVPRAPFTAWALRRTSLHHLAPAWEPFSPSGLKLDFDDPIHTDWMLGAGMDLVHDYTDREVMDATWDAVAELQDRLGSFEAAVVTGSHEVTGVVGESIRVLRDLHPSQLPEIAGAAGIITEQGGAMAHLAQVVMERGGVIMRVSDARARFPAGTEVTLCPAEGTIAINPRRI